MGENIHVFWIILILSTFERMYGMKRVLYKYDITIFLHKWYGNLHYFTLEYVSFVHSKFVKIMAIELF